MRKLLSAFACWLLLTTAYGQTACNEPLQDFLVGWNASGVGISSANFLYDASVGLAGLGRNGFGGDQHDVAQMTGATTASQSWSYEYFPPRIVAGLYSIITGATTLGLERTWVKDDVCNWKLIRNLGIANVVIGGSNIIIGPLFKMLPMINMANRRSNGWRRNAATHFETSFVSSPFNTAGFGMALTMHF